MLRIRCTRCGEQRIPIGALRGSHQDGDEYALLTFRCPSCQVLAFCLAAPAQAQRYARLGASIVDSPFPREHDEPRHGPPICWDDVLDLRIELERLDELERQFLA